MVQLWFLNVVKEKETEEVLPQQLELPLVYKDPNPAGNEGEAQEKTEENRGVITIDLIG